MKIFVTGASGFVGSSLVRLLLQRGAELKLLVRPTSNLDRIQGLDVEVVQGDLRDGEKLTAAMKGCQQVYHVAGLYTLADRPRLYEEINVVGTRNILDGAARAGVERVLHTSTVAAVGSAPDLGLADEETPWNLQDLSIPYVQSKRRAEELALERAAEGQDVVVVNPAGPIGPGDVKPTPTGGILLSFLKGRLPFIPEAHNNFVGVEDVALGHILAMEKGVSGERYILGGENLTTTELLRRVAQRVHRRRPFKLPYFIAYVSAVFSEILIEWILRQNATLNRANVRFLGKKMSFSSDKARNELGWIPESLDTSIESAIRWFCDNGYFGKRRKKRILKRLKQTAS